MEYLLAGSKNIYLINILEDTSVVCGSELIRWEQNDLSNQH